MPIQFRCTSCNQKLAISRRKAGKVVKCPGLRSGHRRAELGRGGGEGAVGGVGPAKTQRSLSLLPSPPPVEPQPVPEVTEPPPDDEALFGDVAGAVFEDLEAPDDIEEPYDDRVADEPTAPEPEHGRRFGSNTGVFIDRVCSPALGR